MSRKLVLHRIINEPVSSNCYVFFYNGANTCVVVDPGTRNCKELDTYLSNNMLIPEFVILTHEHFDHVAGLNYLKDKYDPKIISSSECSAKIVDPKKNLSLFYDQQGFESYPADIFVEDIGYELHWNQERVSFLSTPGHSSASISFMIHSLLFSGDTIINMEKTIVKLPTGSKQALISSIQKISNFVDYPIVCLPGHGDEFTIKSKDELLGMNLYN